MKKLIYSTLLLSALALTSCNSDKKAVNTPTAQSIDSLLLVSPDSIPLLIYKAEQLSGSYNYYDALQYASKAFRLDTNNLEARHIYATCLNNKEDRTIVEVGAAQRHLLYILKRDQKNSDVMVEVATTYGFMQDFETAFEYVNNALRADVRNRDAYVYKGTLYRINGKMDLAKSSYETAIQMDPKYFQAHIFLAGIYQKENNPVAIEYFRTAYELNPTAELKYALAYALDKFDKMEDSKSNYRELAGGTDQNFAAVGNFHLGYIKQLKEKEIDSALYFYSLAVSLDKDYVEAYHNRGMCYEIKGDYSNARSEYLKALAILPDFQLSMDAFNRISKK